MAQTGAPWTPLAQDDGLSRFCACLFGSLARFDQRRWGEVYVRGLARVPGRKSVRRISEHVLGRRADQCLQQFVNQSSWDWAPVRRHLAERTTALLGPRAWVVEEAVLPKNGRNSVGVDRQFSHAANRVLNCQLGLTVLAAAEKGSVPVNWRLMLPPTWDQDVERRERARLPADEVHRPRWQYLLESLDEMTAGWGLGPLPVVVDARQHLSAEPLLRGLESRGLCYAVQVDSRTPVARSASGAVMTAAECLARSLDSGTMTLRWRDARTPEPRYVTAALPDTGAAAGGRRPGWPPYRRRRLVAEWTPGCRAPRSLWITDVGTTRPSAVLELMALRRRARRELERLSEEAGLRHFEGRSFRGWHHHTTLVSAAHAYRLFERMGRGV